MGFTDQSSAVGDSDDSESTGHRMGNHIVDLLDKHSGALREEDHKRMRKVTALGTG